MPIRYVVAIILAVSLLGVAFTSLDGVASDNSKQQMDAELSELEDTAITLAESEEVPPRGQEGARRHVTIELPGDSLTSEPVESLEIRRLDGNVTMAEYHFGNGATHQRVIEAPIISGNNNSIELTGAGTEHDLVLTLERDDRGVPVVNIRRDTDSYELVVESDDGGVVSVQPPGTSGNTTTQTYDWGTEVELSATANSNYTFAGWEGDVTGPSGSETITVTVDADKTITATFVEEDETETG